MCDELDILIEKAISCYMEEEAEKIKEELKNVEQVFYDITEENKKEILSFLKSNL